MYKIITENFRFDSFEELESFIRTWKKLVRGMVTNLVSLTVTVFADVEMVDRMQLWKAGNRHEAVFLSYPELLDVYQKAYNYIYLTYALSNNNKDKAELYLDFIRVIRDEKYRIANIKEVTYVV